MTRRVCYVTGTRADFGLMRSTLNKLNDDEGIELQIAATGMHLNPACGFTYNEILTEGFDVHKIECFEETGSRESMAFAVADQVKGFTQLFSEQRPHFILVLGDRGEMLAAAVAALYLSIPVIHIHGGEQSGTVDDAIRHSISKLSHFHFVATTDSQARLIRMGENHEKVFVTGAPGLDDILAYSPISKEALYSKLGINTEKQVAIVLFHPNVQDDTLAGEQMSTLLKAIPDSIFPIILHPNSDAGCHLIRNAIANFVATKPECLLFSHLERAHYLGLLAHADILIGNSSSGIIESASFGIPTINIGDRQNGRVRNHNTVDVDVDSARIKDAINAAMVTKTRETQNLYGDGHAGERIVSIIKKIPTDASIIKKTNQY